MMMQGGGKSPPQEGRKIMDKLAEYGKKLNNYVLRGVHFGHRGGSE